MTDPHPNSRTNRGKTLWRSKSTLGTIAAVVLIGGYSLVAPKIRDATGLPLPTLTAGLDGQVRLGPGKAAGDAKARADQEPAAGAESQNGSPSPRSSPKDAVGKAPTSNSASLSPKASSKRGPLADRMSPKSDGSRMSPTKSVPPQPAPPSPRRQDRADNDAPDDSDLLYGRLKEISPKRYVSTSGLLYTPGSAEGHRLEHLRRHTKDQPNRPGSHGVFDGEMEGALKTIDDAYDRAKKKQRTTVSKDDGRTIYTVDMGRRVGFVGGRTGNRKRKPMARRVRLVLEGNRVITAFPL